MYIKELLNWSTSYLKAHNVESSKRNAELLLSHLLDCDRIDLYLDDEKTLQGETLRQFASMINERIKGRPVQYLTGQVEFMGFLFKIKSGVFIPRQETEILVETVISLVSGDWLLVTGQNNTPPLTTHHSPLTILDIGTGCGNIAISLVKHIPFCTIIAVDIAKVAIEVARENAKFHNIEDKIIFLQGDLFNPVEKNNSIDILVSNPPYISTSEATHLPLEVAYEPSIALYGGTDGLDYYRRIVSESPNYVRRNGYVIMEIGYGQSQDIQEIIRTLGHFKVIEVVKDYSGIERVIVAQKTDHRP